MVSDILTVLWKELRELPVAAGGGFRGGKGGMLIFLLVFGVYMPLQSGPGWVTSPLSLLYWAWVPFLLVSSVIADSFAGERERHTLETLLASRLSDKAILFGKLGAGIVYGWGITIACLLLGLVALNLVHGKDGLLLYSPAVGGGILALTFLVAALASGLGVLISLRAATVRQAQQTFSFAFLLVFVPIFALPLLPEAWRVRFSSAVMNVETNLTPLVLVAGCVLLLLDGILIAASLVRFQRSKLILD
ncbi:MAG: ABC transporter permease [Chloroflexota bacterium]